MGLHNVYVHAGNGYSADLDLAIEKGHTIKVKRKEERAREEVPICTCTCTCMCIHCVVLHCICMSRKMI